VSLINGARVRKLLPASAVAAVLAIAYMSPLPADASKVNNCGVKGGYAYGGYAYAFHDHGKPCPNRPFPGKGEGIEKFIGTSDSTTSTVIGETKSSSNSNPTTEDEGNQTTDVDVNTSTSGKGHGHGKGHGRGKGNS
jgi:hypothetical protein